MPELQRFLYFREDLPEEHLRALGAISANAAKLENALVYCVCLLSSTTIDDADLKQTLLLVGGESMETLLGKVDKLFRYKIQNDGLKERWDELFKLLDGVRIKRNRNIHSSWTLTEQQLERIKMSKHVGRDLEVLDVELVPLDALKEEASEIFDATMTLIAFTVAHIDLILSEWMKHRQKVKEEVDAQAAEDRKKGII